MTYVDFIEQSSAGELLEKRRHEVRLLPQDQAFFIAYPDIEHWLVILSDEISGETPDTVAILPMLKRIADCSTHIDLRVVFDDDETLERVGEFVNDPSVADGFADADFPLVLFFDYEWQYQEQWGPHPQAFDELWEEWLTEHPDFERLNEQDDLTDEEQALYDSRVADLTQTMRLWYNSGLTKAAVTELRELLMALHEESSDGDEDT